MKYTISLETSTTHLLKICVEIEVNNVSWFDLKLPIWRPGRYEAANYAKNVQRFKAYSQGGTNLKVEKQSASSWRVYNENEKVIIFEYLYYAHQLDAGNSWFGENMVYINFVNCLMYLESEMNSSHYLSIDLPNNYKIACGLEKSDNSWFAPNYYAMVDSPLVASEQLQHLSYEVSGTPFNIWMHGDHQLDCERLVKEFELFSAAQLRMMGDFPFNQYHFLLLFTPYKFYHGVEHGNSTVICIGPGEQLHQSDLYSELLGVSSHELFHAWNIIKIRPKELMPYDFGKPPIFKTGFVAEGFTTYYGDLFLVRGGVFSEEWYLKELNKLLQRHFNNFGRLINSVIDSSIDLWVDGYQPSAPNKKSSIYVEGAMVALLLDLLIRKNTQNKQSLDDVVRTLDENFRKSGIGYSYEDIINICAHHFGGSLDWFFEKYVSGTEDKKALLQELLELVGCELNTADNKHFLERELGIKCNAEDEFRVVLIEPRSVGEKYISLKDKIIEINNLPVGAIDFETFNTDKITLKIERFFKIKIIEIDAEKNSYLKKYSVIKINNPSEEQRGYYKSWIND